MDTKDLPAATELRDAGPADEAALAGPSADAGKPEADAKGDRADAKKAKDKGKKKAKVPKKKKKKSKQPAHKSESDSSSSSSDSDGDSSSSSDSSSSESESEDYGKKKRAAKKRVEHAKERKKAKAKKGGRRPRPTSDSSDSDSDQDDEDNDPKLLSDDKAGDQAFRDGMSDLRLQMQQLAQAIQGQQIQFNSQPFNPAPAFPAAIPPPARQSLPPLPALSRMLAPEFGRRPRQSRYLKDLGLGLDLTAHDSGGSDDAAAASGKKPKHARKGRARKSSRLDYKRVDQVWDNSIHNYKLQDTAEESADTQFDEYLFHVRRTFDWEGKYKTTIVDIKSKPLRECLQEVIGNVKGVSLVDDTPKLDPNMLFLYLDDFKKQKKELKKRKPSGDSKSARKKDRKKIDDQRSHLKVLIKFVDKDYAQIKSSLYPMLQNGLITFDLLWALWKPNTLAYTTTYGSHEDPRVFKVEISEKHYGLLKGEYYFIDGKYFEFDGKQFGYGNMAEEIPDFRGARKITSLPCYPLMYHKNQENLRQELIERGKKFVSLSGVNYKSHQGMAYFKKKKAVVKVNINGRIMIDPSIHRRINPNYPVSLVRPKDHDIIEDVDSDDEGGGCCGGSDSDDSDDDGDVAGSLIRDDDEVEPRKVKYVTKVVQDEDGQLHSLRLREDELENERPKEKLDQVPGKDDHTPDESSAADGSAKSRAAPPEFSDEEYLIASPVLLGFAFAEKLWLEFTVSGVKEIQWNETAYDSLVLEPKTKDIVKALVESHKYHAAESIDDVIQGKGKGLVAVMHGPPGTGKTLTAEGISELLKCPLYMVSAGELGTDSRYLESELQKILDICHAWGAILLLDEADVFLEKRNMHDIHRNALVSIFLRQLEYFQGILFLTTNRVETFDDAFQSRIHIALRYDSLDIRAKKAIFKIFIERVRCMEQIDLMPFSEEDLTDLAKHDLNGRQIKNTVRTAQALAVNKGEPLSMTHIRQVLEVHRNFDRDLKGGTGYEDAMRGYF